MADIGQKRKRSAEDATSNKKASSATIAVAHRGRNGPLPVIALAKGIRAPSVTFDAYTNDENENAIILQSSKHARLDYTTTSTNDELAHYTAFFDPQRSTLKIYPAHQTQLQCILRTAPSQNIPRKSVMSQRIALGEEFGTKKAKKIIASRTVNAITTAPPGTKDAVQDAILEEVADQTGKEVVVELSSQLLSKPIPQPNLEATKVEEVYDINKLIPPYEMRLLSVKEWQEKARANENIQLGHRFTAWRVAALGKSDDVPRLKALRYTSLLLRFHDLLRSAGKGGKKVPKKEILTDKLSDFPRDLIDSICRRFSDDKMELSKWHLEFLHIHICVLALYIDLWEMDTSNIRDDLKLDNKTIVQYFSELGCKINAMTEKERAGRNIAKAQAAQVKIARLKLPLEFPKAKTGRRK